MTIYKTAVSYVSPSRVWVVGNKWVIEHWCTTCRQQVKADQLVEHAKGHLPDELQAQAETVLDHTTRPTSSSPATTQRR